MFIIKHISKCWRKAKKGFFYYFKIRFLTLTVKSWTTTKHWNQINRAQFTNYSTYPTSKSTSYSHELLLQRASCHIWQGSWICFWWRTQLTSFAEQRTPFTCSFTRVVKSGKRPLRYLIYHECLSGLLRI